MSIGIVPGEQAGTPHTRSDLRLSQCVIRLGTWMSVLPVGLENYNLASEEAGIGYALLLVGEDTGWDCNSLT